ncbi:hypothetical protein ACPXCG_17695 [Gordonia sp. DT218]|uniref:hypothetical protein n=1 Tax=Gordonia sp. DT218 TaxID=3416659 RepID=UPI003CE986D7
MTVRVEPQIYYDGAKKLTDIAHGIETASNKLISGLSDTGSMSGSSGAAQKWATSYDKRAQSATDSAIKLCGTLEYFGGLMALAGYNHELANYRANSGPDRGPEPHKPATVPPPFASCIAGAPSSGGPGNGLVSGISALMVKIHVHVPDGDSDKLGKASSAWRQFHGTEAVAHAASDISGVMNSLGGVDAPDVFDILAHLRTIERAAHDLYESATQLSSDCDSHKAPLDSLREKIREILQTLEEAIAVSLAITILADLVTAGVGIVLDAATLAKSARDVDTAAAAITGAVDAAQIDRALLAAAAEEDTLATTGAKLDEISELSATDLEEGLEQARPAPDSLAAGGHKPTTQEAQDIISSADRKGSGLKSDVDHRAPSYVVDEIGKSGKVFEFTGGDGVTRTIVQTPGEVNGVPGRFEWIIDTDGTISHERFIRDGTLNGIPNRP